MSDSGLFSGVYQGIRDHADLLDRVLVRLKAGTSLPDNAERQRLAAWLVSLSEPKSTDCFASMVRMLLRSQGIAFQQGWAEIGASLRAGAVGLPEVDRLEQLARVLEREQAATLARLRGEG